MLLNFGSNLELYRDYMFESIHKWTKINLNKVHFFSSAIQGTMKFQGSCYKFLTLFIIQQNF